MSLKGELERLFPEHAAAERSADWEALERRHQCGQVVNGKVVMTSTFGAWVDLGFGFPALLEIIHIEGLTPERYRDGDWGSVGSMVQARVAHFDDSLRQIALRQVDSNRGE